MSHREKRRHAAAVQRNFRHGYFGLRREVERHAALENCLNIHDTESGRMLKKACFQVRMI